MTNYYFFSHFLNEIDVLKEMLKQKTMKHRYKDIIRLIRKNLGCYINCKEFFIDKANLSFEKR